MAETTNRKPGVVARWREKRKLRRERRRIGMDSRLGAARDRNMDAGRRHDPSGMGGAGGSIGGPG
jgi:hypothetical protein